MSDDECVGDFFAKKDKVKKPKKNKKKLKSYEIGTDTPSDNSSKPPVRVVDEWNDFEEEKEKDYSSLKIQSLQVADEASREEEEVEDTGEDDIDGEDSEKQDKQSGIWKASNTSQAKERPVQPEMPSSHNVVSGKYVPPSMKNRTLGSSAPMRRRGAPPDIGSKAMFPTLGVANQELGASKTPSDFEMVKKGVRSNDARIDDSRQSVNLGNRFDGLRS